MRTTSGRLRCVGDHVTVLATGSRRPDQTARAVRADPRSEAQRLIQLAARRRAAVGWTIAYPTGAIGPVRILIALHGRWATPHRHLRHRPAPGSGARPTAGCRHPAVRDRNIDGGDAYGVPVPTARTPGRWWSTSSFRCCPLGLDTSRFGLLGWSMGGYGALWLASLLGPQRVAAVVAPGPALWLVAGDAAPGGLDSAADLRRLVFARRANLAGIPLRIDCGAGDPFYRHQQFRRRTAHPARGRIPSPAVTTWISGRAWPRHRSRSSVPTCRCKM